MRKSINIGEKKGIKESVTDKELFGLRITNMIKSKGIIINIITGIISCWASFSELTIEPIAAKIVEKSKYPRTKNKTK
jgi:hypothetical protein